MKRPTLKNCLWGILVILLLIFPAHPAYSAEGGVVQIYKNATAPFDDKEQVDADLSLPIKTVRVSEKYQGGRFLGPRPARTSCNALVAVNVIIINRSRVTTRR